ncbi:MAG: RDD family protein [Bacteroidota bacterium]
MIIDISTFKFKTNLKKRICATLLDYGLYLLAFYVYVMFFGHDNDEGGQTVNGLLALPIFIAWFIYFVVIEAFYGATLGHQGFNLKVLTLNRKNIEFTQALKRHLLDPIDILFSGIPAIIAIKNSDKHQRIGDMWAKTSVVDTTDPEQYLDKETTVSNDKK